MVDMDMVDMDMVDMDLVHMDMVDMDIVDMDMVDMDMVDMNMVDMDMVDMPAKRRRRMTQGKPPLVQAARRIPSGLIGNLIFKLLMQISFQKYIYLTK